MHGQVPIYESKILRLFLDDLGVTSRFGYEVVGAFKQQFRDCIKLLDLHSVPEQPIEVHVQRQFDTGPIRCAESGLSLVIAISATDSPMAVAEMITRFALSQHLGISQGIFNPGLSLISAFARENSKQRSLASNSTLEDPDHYFCQAEFVRHLIANFGHDRFRSWILAGGSDSSFEATYMFPLESHKRQFVRDRETSSRYSAFSFLRRIARFYRKHLALTISLFATIVGISLGAQIPALFGAQSVAAVISTPGSAQISSLAQIVGVLLIGGIVSFGLIVARGRISSALHGSIQSELQNDIFRAIQEFPAHRLEQTRPAELNSIYSDDTRTIRSSLETLTSGAGSQLILAVTSATTLLTIHVPLGVAIISTVALFALGLPQIQKRVLAAGKQLRAQSLAASHILQESVEGHLTIQAYGAAELQTLRHAVALDALSRAESRSARSASLFSGAVTISLTAAIIVTYVFAACVIAMKLAPGLNLVQVTQIITVVPILASAVSGLTGIGAVIRMASPSLNRVSQFLVRKEDSIDTVARPEADPLRSEIKLDSLHVTFGSGPVLCGLSLLITAGQHMAIVGESGCGKSTVAKLLLGFIEPDEGSIFYDGKPFGDYNLNSIRQQIGIVFQETFLFDSTVRDNVRVGFQASDAEVWRALEIAELAQFVRGLPQGLNTLIGDRGHRLSGGQKQRIGLARAVIRNASVLILDEPTSALDPETEARVIENLSKVRTGLTTITITHNCASILHVDQVGVLQNGLIAEVGSPTALIKKSGLFSNMVASQARKHDDDHDQRVQMLRFVPFFRELDAEWLNAIAAMGEVNLTEPNETIVRQGDRAEAMYLVISGEYLVFKDTEQEPVNRLFEGNLFGEAALIENGVRSATVISKTAGKLYVLGRSTLEALNDRYPGLLSKIESAAIDRQNRSPALESL